MGLMTSRREDEMQNLLSECVRIAAVASAVYNYIEDALAIVGQNAIIGDEMTGQKAYVFNELVGKNVDVVDVENKISKKCL